MRKVVNVNCKRPLSLLPLLFIVCDSEVYGPIQKCYQALFLYLLKTIGHMKKKLSQFCQRSCHLEAETAFSVLFSPMTKISFETTIEI